MESAAIVEDNPTNRELMSGTLRRAGYELLLADDAETGLPTIGETLPDLVPMDVHMPGLDGFSATRVLESDPRTTKVPVVAVTERGMFEDRDAAQAAGCEASTPKPMKYEDVLQTIEAVLRDGEYD